MVRFLVWVGSSQPRVQPSVGCKSVRDANWQHLSPVPSSQQTQTLDTWQPLCIAWLPLFHSYCSLTSDGASLPSLLESILLFVAHLKYPSTFPRIFPPSSPLQRSLIQLSSFPMYHSCFQVLGVYSSSISLPTRICPP